MSPYRTLLVGTDGSPAATEAVRTAAELAKAFDATLILLSAFEGADEGAEDVFGLWERGRPQVDEETPDEFGWATAADAGARAVVDAAVVVAERAGVERLRVLVASGEAARVILQTAERESVDLIVIGSKATTALERLIEGSVPGAIAHNAPCDLIIVPGP